ncbi:MAG: DUF4097 domain-containing protein [Candidatus Aminicenantaceae bacterium]
MKVNKALNALAILAALFLVVGFYPSQLLAKEKYEEKFAKTESLARDGKIVLKNVSGNIEVKSWDKGEVKIDALKVSKASSLEKAKENAQKITIEVNKEGDILRIETKYPKTKLKSLSVSIHYQLMIPDKASPKIRSVSGDVSLENIGGEVEVSVVSGDVVLIGAGMGVECKAVSGDLKLKDITGDAYLNTVSGNITLDKLRGSIEAETVSGKVELSEVSEAKVVRGKTLSGSIIYDGKINPEGKYTLKSHSGNIEMILPPDSGFEVEASTFSGNIKSDFDITISGKMMKREIHGVVKGGGADVKLSTFSGGISLEKK